jgi:hypothetical protein
MKKKRSKEEQFISCPEPVSEQPSSEVSQPASFSHPPVPTRDIQPCVSSCVTEQVACYKFSGVCRLAYEPVKEYMELYFLHVLKPAQLYPNLSIRRKAEGCNRSVVMVASSVTNHRQSEGASS